MGETETQTELKISMNHITEATEISEIYASIQVGEIPDVKIGDTINGKYLIIDSIGNFTELEEGKNYFLFTEVIRNHSTQLSFVERYVSTEQQPLRSDLKHLEVISVESVPLAIAA